MIALPRSTYDRRPLEEPASVAVAAPDGDQVLVDAITAIRRAHPAYGYRRVTAALRREGPSVDTSNPATDRHFKTGHHADGLRLVIGSA